ncbi:MAG TPA: ABC transporter ATP-binding protein [Solirubrobacteraceae bacterium]|nr:ABC transporter ATP-binding protein [Solirubrobacteraceae bacterium]
MSTIIDPAAQMLSAAGAGPAAVHLGDVHKSFKLPHEKYHTFKQRALHGFRQPGYDLLHAVNGVSVDIRPGEFFGIVGRNGSGKSTLLKCLAGIYRIDQGEIALEGRLAPFIELGVGFNPELTARDNAIINAIMLGLTRREAEARLDQIVAFAELEEFMDLRLKNYSSGMHVRLAFSVAIQVDADILLIDEVLAVGDANFQQKCFDEFARLRSEGKTIIFVTHDMGAVERFCDRAMLMDHGNVVDIGQPSSIARQYNELNFRRVRAEAQAENGPETLRRAPVAELLNASFRNGIGQPIVAALQGEPCEIELAVRFHQDTVDPLFSVSLHNEVGQHAFATSTAFAHGPTGTFRAGQIITVRMRFENYLAPGRYHLTAAVTRDGSGADAYDLRENMASLLIHASHSGGGAVDLPHSFQITPE